MKNIAAEITQIKNMLTGVESPRLSREQCCKYLKIGRPKLEILIREKKIEKYVDEWGQEYYMKPNLDKYLLNNESHKKVYLRVS
jgi:hypothetical protein